MGRLLFFPLFTSGHLNVCLTLAQRILDLEPNQHEIYVLIDLYNQRKFSLRFPAFHWLTYEIPPASPANSDSTETVTSNDEVPNLVLDMILEESQYWPLDPLPKEITFAPNYIELVDLFEHLEPELRSKINQVNPDVILIDQLFTFPIGIDAKVPWVLINSSAENFVGQSDLPPPKSGLPSTDTDEVRKQWKEFQDKLSEGMQPLWDRLNQWLAKCNLDPLRPGYYYNISPYLNICNVPSAISLCNEHVRLIGKWARLQSPLLPSAKDSSEQLNQCVQELGLNTRDKSKPIVYFSLGSMAFVRIDLMQKVIDWLADIDCEVVVSAGRSFEALQPNCPANVRLARSVPQSLLLQKIDLMVTHGGNNTVTECLHWGVPMLVLPLFSDQHCNAARLVERKLGDTLNPFRCTRQQFQNKVRHLLSDRETIERVQQVGRKIRQDTGLDQACRQIVQLIHQS